MKRIEHAGRLAVAAAALAFAPSSGAAPTSPTAVDYARDIQPLLAKHCYSCHGPEKVKGGLRLDTKKHAFEGGDTGPAIVVGKGAESLLYKNISGANPDSIMPPKGERLSEAQVALIKSWIDAGAPWPADTEVAAAPKVDHWSFKPVQRTNPPKVRNSRWVTNPIDNFVLARLEKEKIKPSPEADRATLIRRLSMDLLGLLPKATEVEAFVKDKSPRAYEDLVDRLLASPHFGERWGRHWLDLARYADSDGYEKDTPRPYAYIYRDWVIAAINRDLPFDQFTIEQLAGDLLPNATEEQKIATGFHRNTLTNKEGGVDKEEFRCKAVVDRVSTTGTVWLGLTVACAECHTHKYDPITQKEFYQMFAFFNNADELDMPAPTPDERAKYEAAKQTWDAQQTALKKEWDAFVAADITDKLAAWEQEAQSAAVPWTMLDVKKTDATGGVALKVQADKSIVATGANPDTATYTVEAETELPGITGFRLEVLDDPDAKKGVGRSKGKNFVLNEFTVQVVGPDGKKRTVKPAQALANHSQDNYQVGGAIDGDAKSGWAIKPLYDQNHLAVFPLKEELKLSPGSKLIFTLDQKYGTQHTIAQFRLSVTATKETIAASMMPDAIAKILNTDAAQRTAKQKAELAKYYRETVDPEGAKLTQRLAEHAKKAPALPPTKAQTLVERIDQPRDTFIHIRGDFLRKGNPVEPGTLAVLNPFKPRDTTPDRLDFAKWLVDPANPLTGRVAANHVWRTLFGRGLVPTVEDFGVRGEKPSHPELLDWLASEYIRLGWSRKALVKTILMSSAYRQSSAHRPELAERDPLNTLLSRQNRYRLDAENVRDIYLSASGLLNPKIGGPSIRPPLPADIAALGYANSVKWQESPGAEKYRRGMYIFFQRTVPYPMLMTFDAPDSNVTCTRRERSNTPLQALTLMNDVVFFECSQALARRVADDESTLDEKIKHLFQSALSRQPTKPELARLKQLYFEHLVALEQQPEAATKILGLPESKDSKPKIELNANERATMVALARVVLNLDEFITRE
ncbi:MAG: PSD1 and planctomycete cytochrome C domain-containing protein [Verrucomicrobiota bacterium]